MLNYLSAELYKLRHKKSLFIGMAVLLGLESLLFTPNLWMEDTPTADALALFLDTLLPLGLFLAPVFAVLVFDDQYGQGTMKNEVVFGVPKSRIYLGKLLTGMVTGTLAAAVAVGWYLLLCVLTAGPLGTQTPWGLMLLDMVGAWLTWLAAFSFAIFLLFSMRSTTGAMILAYLVAFVGTPVGIVGVGESAAPWIKLMVNLFYSAPYQRFWLWGKGTVPLLPGYAQSIDWTPLNHALVVCVVWVGGCTALGLLRLRRREIK